MIRSSTQSLVMQLIKHHSNIKLLSKILLGITVFISSILLFSIFFGTAKYSGWDSIIFVYPTVVSFYLLVNLFFILLIYSVFYAWELRKWPVHNLAAISIIIVVYVILSNTK